MNAQLDIPINNKNDRLQVRIEPELNERLKQHVAGRFDVNKSTFTRMAIIEKMDRENAKDAFC